MNQFRKLLSLPGQTGYGLGSLGHGVGDLSAHVVAQEDGVVDLLAGGGLFLAGRGNGVDLIGRGFRCGHDLFQRAA